MSGGVFRTDLVGLRPHIEFRGSHYFVCFEEKKCELVMAFENKYTARELAVNVYHGTPFFTAIPVVTYRTPYPRPWLVYPDLRGTAEEIEMRLVSGG